MLRERHVFYLHTGQSTATPPCSATPYSGPTSPSPKIRSRPGKTNQRKGQNEKFMNFAHFCEFLCFPWENKHLVSQCSATPATVAATPPCSATPFQTQISVRHPGTGGGGKGATPKFSGGVARHRCYTCKTL